MNTDARRALPSIDRLLHMQEFETLAAGYGRPLLIETLRKALSEMRARMHVPDARSLALDCEERLQGTMRSSLRPVFNLTGTVLHTNLGRALYPAQAIEAAVQAMARPVNLEYDLDGAARGERDLHVETWLKHLTGAEAAVVVNNNAAAVYLALNTIAAAKEVVVSRGELVEIGGSFRIPDIMASSGCVLREVGTTNRTHASDYERAIGERTAALMRVHASNYEIRGFTAAVATRELGELSRRHGRPLIVDLGSGMLIDLEPFGLPHEPTPRETISDGADLVTFSGDKLLGGPQCGLIAGSRELIERIRRNPMKRALRLDKVRLAALEAVLRLYADPVRLSAQLPTLRLLMRSQSDIEQQSHRLLQSVCDAVGPRCTVTVAPCASQVGSGALPVDTLPSAALRLEPPEGNSADALAAALRRLPVPVLGRILKEAVLLDLRCLEETQEAQFVQQLAGLQMSAAS